MTMEKTRSAGLDIIRTLAIVFVVGSHFFLHTSFNGAVFSGGEMFFLGVLQTLFLTNVCLFMMLTGYLNINKTPCRKYYKGALRVLGSYLFFSLLIIAFRKYWLGETFSWLQWTKKVLDYSAIPYAWYIEMWIGLFLLTPFLNVLWRNLGGRRNQLLLIATLFVMGALPDLTNRYGAYVFPGWWQQASFPLIYFFLGCGVREWQPSALKLHSARLATKPTPEQPYGREDSSEEHNAKMPRLAQTVLGGCRTRLAAKIKPEQPYGCEDFIKARNEVMRPSRTVCGGGYHTTVPYQPPLQHPLPKQPQDDSHHRRLGRRGRRPADGAGVPPVLQGGCPRRMGEETSCERLEDVA